MIINTEKLTEAKRLAESIMDQDMCNSPLAVSLAKLILEMDTIQASPGPQSCAKTENLKITLDLKDKNFHELLGCRKASPAYDYKRMDEDFKDQIRKAMSDIERYNGWRVNNYETFSPAFVNLKEYYELLKKETNPRNLIRYIPSISPSFNFVLDYWRGMTEYEQNCLIAKYSDDEKRLALINLSYHEAGLTLAQYDLFCKIWSSPKFPGSEIRKIEFVSLHHEDVEFRSFSKKYWIELFTDLRYQTGHFTN